jgi:hypothetical protein
MTGGFGAVPEELYRTANQIGDVIGGAAGLLWQGPSGDYGHPGVQAGWGSFLENVKAEVEKLAKKAEGHGEDLRTAAVKYANSDTGAVDVLGKFGAGLSESPNGPGGLGAVLGGFGSLGESKIGAGLDGVPGGGFTGGLTPTKLDERFEESAPGKLHDVPGGGYTGGATGRISGSIDVPDEGQAD